MDITELESEFKFQKQMEDHAIGTGAMNGNGCIMIPKRIFYCAIFVKKQSMESYCLVRRF